MHHLHCLPGLLCIAAILAASSFASGQDGPAATRPTTAPDYSNRILTPKPKAEPRITGARIFGVRASHPFLFTITATGERPMTFSADDLPDGLKLDENTGRITGELDTPGEHVVTFHAKNDKGEATRPFKIVVGDKIALTPPMGWNSWNCWAWTVDQDKVARSARSMVSSGLINHGWTYINIDDTWQGDPDPKSLALQPNNKFPNMKGLIDDIHNMGLKAGIYSTPWIGSYAMFQGGSATNAERRWDRPPEEKRFVEPNPHHKVGEYRFVTQDAEQWAHWGFDYLKYDWNPNDVPNVKEMSDALRGCGRDIVYSLSNSASFEHAAEYAQLANAWRTTGDIEDSWFSMATIGFNQNRWAKFGGPGHWNDPDMLVVGFVGWGPRLHPTRLTADEQFTHISLWCLLSAPLLIGCDMERLDPFTLSLLSNDEVLDVNQDPLGKEATQVATSGGDTVIRGRRSYSNTDEEQKLPRLQVWAKDLEDGSKAVGLFNLGDEPATVTANFGELNLSSRQSVRDLWRQRDVGQFSDRFETTVQPHGVVLLKISSAK